jgi:hypothetical protein
MSGGTHHVLPIPEQNGGVPLVAAPLTNGNAPGIHNATVNGFTPGSDDFKLGDFCIDEDRPMKVVVIGAGFSGIIAGIRSVVCSYLFQVYADSSVDFPRKLRIWS